MSIVWRRTEHTTSPAACGSNVDRRSQVCAPPRVGCLSSEPQSLGPSPQTSPFPLLPLGHCMDQAEVVKEGCSVYNHSESCPGKGTPPRPTPSWGDRTEVPPAKACPPGGIRLFLSRGEDHACEHLGPISVLPLAHPELSSPLWPVSSPVNGHRWRTQDRHGQWGQLASLTESIVRTLEVQKETGEGFLEEVASEMTFKGCDGERALVEGTV